ncbi:uncharacterized protein LOC101854936, partial [Aplysia californica]|uniref:Uncharacterized protein LOC101854936 n=1 Tax=Aplysia californica TaxID=6500 RepID=A0ABM0ZWF3_APLCA
MTSSVLTMARATLAVLFVAATLASAAGQANGSVSCEPGKVFSLETLDCQPCGWNQTRSAGDPFCYVCPYQNYSDTHCDNSSAPRDVFNSLVDITLPLTVVTPVCGMPKASSNVTVSEFVKSLISQLYNLTSFNASGFYRGLCFDEDCRNINVTLSPSHVCVPDCNDLSNCSRYITRLAVTIFHSRTFSPSIDSLGILRSTVDILLETLPVLPSALHIISGSNSSEPLPFHFEPPFRPRVQAVEYKKRVVRLVVNLKAPPAEAGNSTMPLPWGEIAQRMGLIATEKFQQLPGFLMAEFFYMGENTFDKNSFLEFHSVVVFTIDVDMGILNSLGRIMVTSHAQWGGSFEEYPFIGPMKVLVDIDDGEEVDWCSVLTALGKQRCNDSAMNCTQDNVFDKCGEDTVSWKTTLFLRFEIDKDFNASDSWAVEVAVRANISVHLVSLYSEYHIAVVHVLPGSTVVIIRVDTDSDWVQHLLERYIYKSFLEQPGSISVDDTVYSVVSVKLYEDENDAVMDQGALKLHTVCDMGYECPKGSRCVATDSHPKCEAPCDYGEFRERDAGCEMCPNGTTTLVPEAISHHMCVRNCSSGQVLSLETLECQDCPDGFYPDSYPSVCYVNSTLPVENRRMDIHMTVTLVTNRCDEENTNFSKANVTLGLKDMARGVISARFYMAYYLPRTIYLGLCEPECVNILSGPLNEKEVCVPDCGGTTPCDRFLSKVSVQVYNAWELAQSLTTSGHNRSSVDVLLEHFYDLTSILIEPGNNEFGVHFEFPIKPEVTFVDYKARLVFFSVVLDKPFSDIRHQWSDTAFKLGERMGELAAEEFGDLGYLYGKLDQISDHYDKNSGETYIMVNSTGVFKNSVNKTMLETIALRMLRAHISWDGQFGEFQFRGGLGLFRTAEDRWNGVQAVSWCDVVESVGVPHHCGKEFNCTEKTVFRNCSGAWKTSLFLRFEIDKDFDASDSWAVEVAVRANISENLESLNSEYNVAVTHVLPGSTVVIIRVDADVDWVQYLLERYIYKSFLEQPGSISVNDTVYLVMSVKMYEDENDAVMDQGALKLLSVCYMGNICPEGSRCVATDSHPKCEVPCDYGEFRERDAGCEMCPNGTTTLVQEAISRHMCVRNCSLGQVLSLETLECQDCPDGFYPDSDPPVCYVNSTLPVENRRMDIHMTVTLVINRCDEENTYFSKANITHGLKDIARGMIAARFYKYQDLSRTIYLGLCEPECVNILSGPLNEKEVCVPDCGGTTPCDRFLSKVSVQVYNAWELAQSQTASRHNRSSVDVLLEHFYDLTPLYEISYSEPEFDGFDVHFEFPIKPEVTFVDYEARLVFFSVVLDKPFSDIRYQWSDTAIKLGERMGELAADQFGDLGYLYGKLDQISDHYDENTGETYIMVNSMGVFKNSFNKTMLEAVAARMLRAHISWDGQFGEFLFRGRLGLFRTAEDRQRGVQAVSWCDVVESVGVPRHCGKEFTCTEKTVFRNCSGAWKTSLFLRFEIDKDFDASDSWAVEVAVRANISENLESLNSEYNVAVTHVLPGSTVVIIRVDADVDWVQYLLERYIYKSFLEQPGSISVDDTVYSVMSVKMYEDENDAVMDQGALKLLSVCYMGNICPEGSRCVATDSHPKCEVPCDYGEFRERDAGCEMCPNGTTTLVQEAISRHMCVRNCSLGQVLSLETLECQDCPDGFYPDSDPPVCYVNSTLPVENRRMDIHMTVTLVINRCDEENTYFSKANITHGLKDIARGMIAARFYKYQDLSRTIYLGLCEPECVNILSGPLNEKEVCVPDCGGTTPCDRFLSKVSVQVYNAWELAQPLMTSGHNRSSVDVLLEHFYDLTPLYKMSYSEPEYDGFDVHFEFPIKPEVTFVDYEARLVFFSVVLDKPFSDIRYQWSDTAIKLGERMGELAADQFGDLGYLYGKLDQISDHYDENTGETYIMVNSMGVFKNSFNKTMLEAVASRMLRAHISWDGQFGEFLFRGRLGLFRTAEDRQRGVQAVSWCDVVESVGVPGHCGKEFTCTEKTVFRNCSGAWKTSLFLRFEIDKDFDASDSWAVEVAVRANISEHLVSLYSEYHVAVVHVLPGSTVIIIRVDTDSDWVQHLLERYIYRLFLEQPGSISVDDTVYSVVSVKMYEDENDAVMDQGALKLHTVCNLGYECPQGSRCVATDSHPKCEVPCDYGEFRERDGGCEMCPNGTTTLVPEAISRHMCVRNCSSGQVLSLETLECQVCPDGFYPESVPPVCYVNSTLPVENRRMDIHMTVTLVTNRCDEENTNFSKANVTLGLKDIARGLIFARFYTAYDLSRNVYLGLCEPECVNILSGPLNEKEVCVPDCGGTTPCDRFLSKVSVQVYNAWELAQSLTASRHNRSSVDVLLEHFYDLTPLYKIAYSEPEYDGFDVHFEFPIKPEVTFVDYKARLVFFSVVLNKNFSDIWYQWSDTAIKLGERMGELAADEFGDLGYLYGKLDQISAHYDENTGETYIMVNSMGVFKNSLNKTMLESMAARMLRAHISWDGQFGEFQFRGRLGLFRTAEDRQKGVQAVSWCDVVETVSVPGHCGKEFTCTEKTVFKNCSGAWKTSMFLRFEIDKDFDASDSWAVEVAVRANVSELLESLNSEYHVAVIHVLPGSTVVIIRVDTDADWVQYLLERYIYESFLKQPGSISVDDTAYSVVSVKMYENENDAVMDQGALELHSICYMGFECPEGSRCVATNSIPICEVPCDYGEFRERDAGCEMCPNGTTTLVPEAISQHMCVRNCSSAQVLSLETLECQDCPDGFYPDSDPPVCYVNSTLPVENRRMDIHLTVTLVTNRCDEENTNFSKANVTRGLKDMARGLISARFYTAQDLSRTVYLGLCEPECVNILSGPLNEKEVCVPDCGGTTPCDRFLSKVSVQVYNAWELAQSLTASRHNRSSIDVLLEHFYDLTPLYKIAYSGPEYDGFDIHFEFPIKPEVTFVDYEARLVFFSVVLDKPFSDIRYQWSDSAIKLGERMGELAAEVFGDLGYLYGKLDQISYHYDENSTGTYIMVNSTGVFKNSVNKTVLEAIAVRMLKAHISWNGQFGEFQFRGRLGLFQTAEDRWNGVQAVSWCDVVESVGVPRHCGKEFTCTEKTVFRNCSGAWKTSVFLRFEIDKDFDASDSWAVEVAVRANVSELLESLNSEYHVAVVHVLPGSTVVIIRVDTDADWVQYLLEGYIYRLFLEQPGSISVDDTAYSVVSLKMYEDENDAVMDQGALKLHSICYMGFECPEGSRCVATNSLPICEVPCDYGEFRERDAGCEMCPNGTTTLVPEAISQHMCVSNCSSGQVLSLETLECQDCPDGFYPDSDPPVCFVNSTLPVENRRMDIHMTVTVVTNRCDAENTDFSKANVTRGLKDMARGLISARFYTAQDLSRTVYLGLCEPECVNILSGPLNEKEVCVPDCGGTTPCDRFLSKVSVQVYNAWELAQLLTASRHNRSSVDVLLEHFYDLTPLYKIAYSGPEYDGFDVHFEFPIKPEVKFVDYEARLVFFSVVLDKPFSDIRYQWSDSAFKLGERMGELAAEEFGDLGYLYGKLDQISDHYDENSGETYIMVNSTGVFKNSVNKTVLEAIAVRMLKAHISWDGQFGEFQFRGGLGLFRTAEDRWNGVQAVSWCDVVESVGVPRHCGKEFTCTEKTVFRNCSGDLCPIGQNNDIGECVSCPIEQYTDDGQCVPCPEGYTTLTEMALSADECIVKCKAGTGFSWLSMSCEKCVAPQYNNGSDKVCYFCPYTTNLSYACDNSDPVRSDNTSFLDISISVNLTLTSCDMLKMMPDVSPEEVINGMMQYVTRTLNGGSRGLCQPEGECNNIQTVLGNDYCSDIGDRVLVPLNIHLFNVWEEVVLRDGRSQHAVEVFLQTLANMPKFAYYNPSMVAYEPVFSLPTISVDIRHSVGEARRLWVTVNLNVSFEKFYTDLEDRRTRELIENMGRAATQKFSHLGLIYPEFHGMGSYEENDQSYVSFHASLFFWTTVNDSIIQGVASEALKAHSMNGGRFGDSGYSFIGPVYLYLTEEDQSSKSPALDWCKFLAKWQEAANQVCGPREMCMNTEGFFKCEPVSQNVTYNLRIDFPRPFDMKESWNLLENARSQLSALFKAESLVVDLGALDTLPVASGTETGVIVSIHLPNEKDTRAVYEVLVASMVQKSLSANDSSGTSYRAIRKDLFNVQKDGNYDNALNYFSPVDMYVCLMSVPLCGRDEKCTYGPGSTFSCGNYAQYYLRFDFEIPYSSKSLNYTGKLWDQAALAFSKGGFPYGIAGLMAKSTVTGTFEGTTFILTVFLPDRSDAPAFKEIYVDFVMVNPLISLDGSYVVEHNVFDGHILYAVSNINPLDLDVCQVSSYLCASDELCTSGSGTSYNCTLNTELVTPDPTIVGQRDLYPYGTANGDKRVTAKGLFEWDYWDAISEPIKITGGFPFGTEKFTFVHVLPSGVITVGREKWTWWPSLEWNAQFGIYTIAPFWSYMDPRLGNVFYQLYQGSSTVGSNKNSTLVDHVLNRASDEVEEYLDTMNTSISQKRFSATSVLVATWEDVEPFTWKSYYCDELEEGSDENNYFDDDYYDEVRAYCNNTERERNTFQSVLITDGLQTFVLTTYKYGQMKWQFEAYRSIAVGFVSPTPEFRKINDYYNTEITTVLDKRIGNTGRYGTEIDFVGLMDNPDALCEQWYLKNSHLVNNDTYDQMIDGLFDCPCTMERLGRQWWFFEWQEIPDQPGTFLVCAALSPVAKSRLERLEGNTLNRLCCYKVSVPKTEDFVSENGTVDWTGLWDAWWDAYQRGSFIQYNDPDAGHVLLYDPWWWQDSVRSSRQEDMLPHKWCCRDSSKPSKTCAMFNKVRPQEQCNPNATFVSGRALGDPHIKTVDGQDYTMNGLGEYILALVASEDFMLQARTAQAINKDGNKTRATVFVAFVVKEGSDALFQVELNDDLDGMILYANGDEITTKFYGEDSYSESIQDTLGVQRRTRESDGRISVTATFPSSISITVYVGIRNLEFSIDIPTTLKGEVKGLLGNFDGIKTNDFVHPNGTVLPDSMVDSERNILMNFAELWRVTTSNSVFIYDEEKNTNYYQNKTFEPIFLEEVDSQKLNTSRAVCGSDYACVFDLIATDDESFAKYSQATNSEANSIQNSQANSPPSISVQNTLNADGHLEVTEGSEVTISFQATDPDGDRLNYTLVDGPLSGVQLDPSTGDLVYTPNVSLPVAIGVQAQDPKGGRSVVLYVTLEVCTNCSGHGSCDRSDTRDEEFLGGKFLINSCACKPAYSGDNCDTPVYGCASQPCTSGQTCDNLDPDEDPDNERRYKCGACPKGYVASNAVCVDINECSNLTHPVCPEHSTCTNAVGNFSCSCDKGYRKDIGAVFKCNDIDECAEGTHDCQQDCDNTDGSFSCSCLNGNILQDDGRTCKQNSSIEAICNAQGCSDDCTLDEDQKAVCSCPKGYKLSNKTHCVDIDECNTENKFCKQKCANSDGGFSCSCYTGYKLQADQTSCSACQHPYYGEDCKSICDCNGHGTCDSVRGCICSDGWKGESCSQDVNECAEKEQPCPDNQVCSNTVGSYTCSCDEGFATVNGTCLDINECLDVIDHSCSLKIEECVNTVGSFDCVCRKGYARGENGTCEDIDECATKSHRCEHKCENTEGSHNCKCLLGYRLDKDRSSCLLSENLCEGVTDLNCTQLCTVDRKSNQAYCLCNTGFDLVGNETCVDINECDAKFPHLNLCEYKAGCVNTEGGFNCSCPTGSFLDNDGRSCVVCSGGRWGENCSKNCGCGDGASSCDPVQGCVCKDGFKGTQCREDIDECATGLRTCPDKEKCVNTVGSSRCDCEDGLRRNAGQCEDFEECASNKDNNCAQKCENFVGGYQCSCFSGYSFNASENTCTNINECELGSFRCEGDCQDTEGGYRCTCREGLKLNADGVSCRAAEACDPSSNPCEEKDKCRLVNSQTVCSCPRGKTLNTTDNTTCIDVDLCAGDPCSDTCNETADGKNYICLCPPGSKLASDEISCEECVRGTYGLNCAESCNCSLLNADDCNKVNGSCSCKQGWTGATCDVDEDECDSDPCPDNATCQNTPGSFVCSCNPGYSKSNNNSCTVCSPGTYGQECRHQCNCSGDNTLSCDPQFGICSCKKGWEGLSCHVDINECGTPDDQCAAANRTQWICVNDPGSFHCECESGFIDASNVCNDLNECERGSSNQCQQNCNNTEGSYTCYCDPGYKQNLQNPFLCDECAEGTYGQECALTCSCNLTNVASCNKVNGKCNCKRGWTGSSCEVDEDECDSDPCPDNAQCQNTAG